MKWLFSNIGRKLQTMAMWNYIVLALVSIVVGCYFMFSWRENTVLGLIFILGGPFVFLVLCWMQYAVGVIVEYYEVQKSTEYLSGYVPVDPVANIKSATTDVVVKKKLRMQAQKNSDQGIATHTPVFDSNKITCPLCDKTLVIGENDTLLVCPDCGCPIKAIR